MKKKIFTCIKLSNCPQSAAERTLTIPETYLVRSVTSYSHACTLSATHNANLVTVGTTSSVIWVVVLYHIFSMIFFRERTSPKVVVESNWKFLFSLGFLCGYLLGLAAARGMGGNLGIRMSWKPNVTPHLPCISILSPPPPQTHTYTHQTSHQTSPSKSSACADSHAATARTSVEFWQVCACVRARVHACVCAQAVCET